MEEVIAQIYDKEQKQNEKEFENEDMEELVEKVQELEKMKNEINSR